eukprot:g10142.t1
MGRTTSHVSGISHEMSGSTVRRTFSTGKDSTASVPITGGEDCDAEDDNEEAFATCPHRVSRFVMRSIIGVTIKFELQGRSRNIGIAYLLASFYVSGFLLHALSPLFICADPERDHWLTYSFSVELLLWTALLCNASGLPIYPLVLWLNMLALLVFLVLVFTQYESQSAWFKFEVGQFVSAFLVMNLLGAYSREQFARLVFAKLSDLSRTESRSDQLLREMLPSYLLEDFRRSGVKGRINLFSWALVVREYKQMTCLFADISGFTAYSQKVTAHEVVRLVTRLFSAIDDLSRRVGIYKVCTIGDCYVATLEPRQDYTDEMLAAGCSDMFKFAAGLIYLVAGVRDELDIDGLGMRVGLHLGTFVGGVIGQRKLRFDVWGLDVLVTNKMESCGQVGQICASETLREYTDENFPGRFLWCEHCFVDEYQLQCYRLLKDKELAWS